MSATVGAAWTDRPCTAAELLDIGDQALYQAKRDAGRPSGLDRETPVVLPVAATTGWAVQQARQPD